MGLTAPQISVKLNLVTFCSCSTSPRPGILIFRQLSSKPSHRSDPPPKSRDCKRNWILENWVGWQQTYKSAKQNDDVAILTRAQMWWKCSKANCVSWWGMIQNLLLGLQGRSLSYFGTILISNTYLLIWCWAEMIKGLFLCFRRRVKGCPSNQSDIGSKKETGRQQTSSSPNNSQRKKCDRKRKIEYNRETLKSKHS